MGDAKIICPVFVYCYFNSWGVEENDNILIFFEEEGW